MELYPYNLPGDWWRVPQVVQPQDAQVAAAASAPQVGRNDTGNQQPVAGWGYGVLSGFGQHPAFCADYVEDCLQTASLALVRGTVLASILSGPAWEVEADEDAPAGAKELFEAVGAAAQDLLIEHGFSALDHGSAFFAPIWGIRNGMTAPVGFKPLEWRRTTIWTTPGGDLAGLRTIGLPGSPPVDLWGANALVMTYGSVLNLYGRSRLKNVWRYVWRQMQVEERIAALSNKAVGAVPEITYMPGNGTDSAGNPVDNRKAADAFGQNVAGGKSSYLLIPNALSALTPAQRNSATVDQILKLVESRLWSVELKDLGDQGPAIVALMGYSAYLDVCIHRAYLRPERSTMEGKHGTKAEAGEHTDTGTADSDLIVKRVIVDPLNKQTGDAMLVENWGKAARGKVRWVARSLRDKQAEADQAMVAALASAAPQDFMARYNTDESCERLGIKVRETPIELPSQQAAQQQATAQPNGENGDAAGNDPLAKRMNGNGVARGDLKMSRDVADVVERLRREEELAEEMD